MNTYRCYCLKNGRIVGVDVLNAANDDEAIALGNDAFKQRNGRCEGIEVWQGSRFVYRTGPGASERG